MSRRRDGLSPKGSKIVAALTELLNVLVAKQPVESRFTVHHVEQIPSRPDLDLSQGLRNHRRSIAGSDEQE
jgi:hypothetical protein